MVGYGPLLDEAETTNARITMSMLGSAHWAASVVPAVTGVWPKYTATFFDDCALKVYALEIFPAVTADLL